MDFETKILYWVDALEDTIESVSINGENRQIVSSENVRDFLILFYHEFHDSTIYFPATNNFLPIIIYCQTKPARYPKLTLTNFRFNILTVSTSSMIIFISLTGRHNR